MAIRRTRAAWGELIEAFERSGEPLAAFCARRKVRPKTLSWWRWKLGTTAKPLRLVELVAKPAGAPTTRAAAVELLVDGVHLRFDAGTAPEYVAAVILGIRAR